MAGPLSSNSTSLESSNALMVLFLSMHTFGWIGSLILLLTVTLSSKVQRHIMWRNLCVAFILSCFSYSLLLLSGQINNPNPNHAVCLIQASAVYAVPSLAAGATLSLALHLWLQFRCPAQTKNQLKRHAIRNVVLVAAPYLLPIGLFTTVFVYGIQHPDQIILVDSQMYCGLNRGFPGKISAIFVAVTMLPTLTFEALVLSNLYRNREEYRKNFSNHIGRVVRIILFTFFGVFAIGISLMYLSSKSYGRLANVLMAIPPVSFVIIFASQTDLLGVWMFWKRTSIPTSTQNQVVKIDIEFTQAQDDDVEKASGRI